MSSNKDAVSCHLFSLSGTNFSRMRKVFSQFRGYHAPAIWEGQSPSTRILKVKFPPRPSPPAVRGLAARDSPGGLAKDADLLSSPIGIRRPDKGLDNYGH